MIALIRLLFASSASVLGLVLLAAAASGSSTAAILALVNAAMSAEEASPTVFALLILLSATGGFAAQFFVARLAIETMYRFRTELSRRILSLPLVKLERIGGARLLAVLTEDVASVVDGIGAVPNMVMSTVTIAGALVYLAVVSPTSLLVWILLAMVACVVVVALMRRVAKRLIQMRRAQDRMFELFSALIGGAKELRLGAQRGTDFFEQGIRETASGVRALATSLQQNQAGIHAVARLATFTGLAVIVFGGATLLGMSRSAVSAFVIVTLFVISPLEGLFGHSYTLSRAGVALRTIRQLDVELSHSARPAVLHHVGAPREQTAITLQDVVYRYQDAAGRPGFTVGPISERFESGTITFIVGANGSGKTTLLKVLCGLYAPTEGGIVCGDVPVEQDNAEWYREHFNSVFADFHLFDELWGVDESSASRSVPSDLERFHLGGDVAMEGRRFSTTELSAGQRRRLALVWALAYDRPVFIFDEWAADQDLFFRELFYRDVLPCLRAQNKIVIVASHDERYFDAADRLLMLELGQVSAEEPARFLAKIRRGPRDDLPVGAIAEGKGKEDQRRRPTTSE